MRHAIRNAAAAVLVTACAGPGARTRVQQEVPMFSAEATGNPNWRFRIDRFAVPEASRTEFEAAMHRSLAFLRTLEGFRGQTVFARSGDPSTLHVVTMAAWESQEAVDRASEKVRAYYRSIGFDPPVAMARWGVRADLGLYQAQAVER